jgi:aminopeptidase N
MNKYFLVLLIFASSICATDKADYNLMYNKIDVLNYYITLRISDSSEEISAGTKINFKAVTNLSELKFNLREMNVLTCELDDQRIEFVHENGIITITPSVPIEKNTVHSLVVKYVGRPKSGLFISKNKYRNFSAFSDNWANYASYWFPSIDHPSDKSCVTFNVTTPTKYEVICNGDLISKSDLETKESVYVYDMKVPIPTYCMVIGVCDFAITETVTSSGVPVYYYTYPQDSLNACNGFKRAADMVSFYEETIGPFPYSRLSLVESSTIFGGMENSSAIFFTEKSPSFTGEKDNEETVAHEIAHQWFGDAVTMNDWSEVWLSEGFATYFTALYFENRDGSERFNRIMNEYMKSYRKSTNWKTPVINNSYKKISDLLNVETYQKGAFFLHKLREEIGDRYFFLAVKEFYKRFVHSNATTKDFKNIVEEISNTELDDLFSEWLYKPGLPGEI